MATFRSFLSFPARVRTLGSVSSEVLSAQSQTESVPPHNPLTKIDLLRLERFIFKSQRLFVLTGAGVSTESGIKDYRSERVGLYATSTHRPTNYSDFLRSEAVRQRYWARNTTAWPFFSRFQPNISHTSLATLEHMNRIHWLVTQNVDNLHHKAGSRRLTELHGTVFAVICLDCHLMLSRDEVQELVHSLNPGWSAKPEGFAPDADVFVAESAIEAFRTPTCQRCGGILKPDVVFFGGSVPKQRVETIASRLAESDAMMVAGSSVHTYSAYRHVKEAHDRGIPVLVLNIGPTRVDSLASVIIRARTGEALGSVMNSMFSEQKPKN